ncbi:MAG: riboflavin biosynthesis protein RibF [Candidatus Marinimicrobia bacterium]|jgi:riboflavin kinase/FMN adenylyltransferase|nr:riboflavin biosynthesis protein RibF [Candidatus Neomarinimicrobiota bacterium]MBT3502263.1 riboflavin biosynthesis protein RibF [Candidatus Neomarinimicrobiota bacterium]MBT3840341.1 riboflavin biosynthesis protein RibF [Candidatus Neomarinimicrobiota bacterium]MBT3998539.1 riboflavin biosynthesis protein RibF [Candidatus Neomarinimicrobiota bacterium]MBT4283139.1 riboflavin biosynthesis protein RibF [Candidatus Neomarinimicrobiota bacterium]
MDIIRQLDKFKSLPASVLTIGSYDGIHRGHHGILTSVVNHAHARNLPSVLVTFDPHPRHILDSSSDKMSLIMGIEQKLEIIDTLGVDIVHVINFTNTFAETTAVDFLNHTVIPNFNPEYIIIGYDHHFGYKREGSPEFLKHYCAEKKIGLDIIQPVSDEGHVISSTRIRQLIQEGFVRRANFELGSIYGFLAKVVYGAGRGKGLNFPTANVIPVEKNQLMPKPGVYFTRGRINGLRLYGMCNFGTRPTFNEEDLVMEIHFFHDRVVDLYGKEIRIEFLERIRDEKKFPTIKDLKSQLINDKQKCLELQGKYE